MSVQGLWTSEIYGLQGWENNGVMVLENGRVLGGGRHHFTIGSYENVGDEVHLSIDVEYHGTPRTLFGSSEKKIALRLDGQLDGDTLEGSVYRPENPTLTLMFRLTKRSDVS